MGSKRLTALIVACMLGAGCSAITAHMDPGELDANGAVCADVYSANRCDLIRLAAAEQLGAETNELTEVRIMPDPNSFDANGNRVLVTYGGGTPLYVRVSRAGGPSQDLMLGCAGVDMRPICTDEPHLYGGNGFNHDIPCAGDPPDGCATPNPTANPQVAARAVPLSIDRLDVPIDHVGDYRVKLGVATLPNGRLSHASMGLVDDWPDGVTILSAHVDLVVESLEPDGKPFWNSYEHGWRRGLERIAVYLVFHVDAFEPGAVLPVKNVLVS